MRYKECSHHQKCARKSSQHFPVGLKTEAKAIKRITLQICCFILSNIFCISILCIRFNFFGTYTCVNYAKLFEYFIEKFIFDFFLILQIFVISISLSQFFLDFSVAFFFLPETTTEATRTTFYNNGEQFFKCKVSKWMCIHNSRVSFVNLCKNVNINQSTKIKEMSTTKSQISAKNHTFQSFSSNGLFYVWCNPNN